MLVPGSMTVGWMLWASTEMPMKATPKIRPMATRVVAALWDSGFLKAGTPLEMASTPVRATAPEENARSKRKTPTAPNSGRPAASSWPPWLVASSVSASSLGAIGGRPCTNTRKRP